MQSDVCSLCLCLASCNNLSEPLAEDARELLAQLLPHLDIKTRIVPQVACTNCFTRLKRYLEFKSRFSQTQACVQAKQSGGLLDPMQAYLRNKSNGREVSTNNVVVCRFCLKQATGSFISLADDQKLTTMVDICLPELDSDVINGCVICLPCYEALDASYSFVTSWGMASRVKEDATEETEVGDVADLNAFKADDLLMSNGTDFDGEIEIKEERRYEQIDEQEVEVKYKVEIEAVHSNDSRNRYDGTEDVKIKEEDVDVEEHRLSLLEDEARDIKEEHKGHDSKHMLKRKSPKDVTMYKCDSCTYESRHKHCLLNHKLTHKSCSEVRMYKCKVCCYRSKYRTSIKVHGIVHKNPEEITMYKCESCEFETKYKCSLKKHEETHTNEKKPMYECDVCSFKTKGKGNYMRHVMVHESHKEVNKYKCKSCTFETRYKYMMRYHKLTHEGCIRE